MAIRKDKIIVIDIEATCWEGFTAPEGQQNEIIEIGVCLLNPNMNPITVSNKRSILVKPQESVISPFCTELTSITPEILEKEGISFDQACKILEDEYDTRNRIWGSWGALDMRMFKSQCRRRKVRYPFSKKHSNLKRVFHEFYGQRMGLARALDAVGINAHGTAHRGEDDAYNTAMLLRYLFEIYGENILKRYGF